MSVSGPVTARDLVPLLWRWQGRLLTGESGLGRAVTGANVMRARMPAFEGFQGGDLALLSLGALRALQAQAPSFTLGAVVEQLAAIGASAIAIAGLLPTPDAADATNTATIPAAEIDETRALANRIGAPLIALPLRTPLIEVERAVIAHVLERRERPADTSPERADAYAATLRASLRAETLDALLAGTYAGEAQMRARATQLGYDLTHTYAALYVELIIESATPVAERAPSSGRAAQPVAATLVQAASPGAQLADELTVALGAWALARPGGEGDPSGNAGFGRDQAAGREQGQRGQIEEVIALLPLAGAAGIIPGERPERPKPKPETESNLRGSLNAELGALSEHARTLLTRIVGEERNGVASGSAGDPAPTWYAGLGEPATTPAGARRSAAEARDAARLGRQLLGPGKIARPADLGVYRLLLALRESGELAPFVERTLAPFQPETRSGEELIETLDMFFASNGNLSEAARRLHLHRNSLLYRLGRASELLGHDLDDADLRFSLHLAIKARALLRLLNQ